MDTRVEKLVGMLESSHKGEVMAAAGKLHEYLQETGSTWSELFQGRSFVAAEKGLQRRVRKASKVLCFLTPKDRQRLAEIDILLDDYSSLSRENMKFLEQIFLRTGA